jgi:hypothetical protein
MSHRVHHLYSVYLLLNFSDTWGTDFLGVGGVGFDSEKNIDEFPEKAYNYCKYFLSGIVLRVFFNTISKVRLISVGRGLYRIKFMLFC